VLRYSLWGHLRSWKLVPIKRHTNMRFLISSKQQPWPYFLALYCDKTPEITVFTHPQSHLRSLLWLIPWRLICELWYQKVTVLGLHTPSNVHLSQHCWRPDPKRLLILQIMGRPLRICAQRIHWCSLWTRDYLLPPTVWIYLHALFQSKIWKIEIYGKVVHYVHSKSFKVIEIGTNWKYALCIAILCCRVYKSENSIYVFYWWSRHLVIAIS